MTILTGEVTRVETVRQFYDKLDVSRAEKVAIFSADERAALLEEANRYREEAGRDRINDPAEAADELINEAVEHQVLNPIAKILRRRDRKYVHIANRVTHTIIEVTGKSYPPESADNAPYWEPLDRDEAAE